MKNQICDYCKHPENRHRRIKLGSKTYNICGYCRDNEGCNAGNPKKLKGE